MISFQPFRTMLLVVAAVLCICLLSGCDQGEPQLEVDLSKRIQINSPKDLDSLTYAYLPQYSHRVSFDRHHRIVRYLSQETGLPIRQVFPDSFAQHVQMVGEGKIDISFSNPLVYIQIADRFQARAIARTVEQDGKSTFRGQIICRKDNKAIQNIQDCREKRWMAVSPTSAGGYLFALAYFQKHGLDKDDFQRIEFSPGPGGKQEKVVQAVYLGEYDIGSIREGTLDLMQDRVDLSAIRVLATTKRYPGWVYAVREGLDAETVNQITKALCALDRDKSEEEEILAQAHIQRIIFAADKEFDPVRELASQTGVKWRE
ncbi:MAG: phosphate/phosphite/phosphonate ABC transporter substrate-binding protein [Thermodesulfobacteriota bacterium]